MSVEQHRSQLQFISPIFAGQLVATYAAVCRLLSYGQAASKHSHEQPLGKVTKHCLHIAMYFMAKVIFVNTYCAPEYTISRK